MTLTRKCPYDTLSPIAMSYQFDIKMISLRETTEWLPATGGQGRG